MLRRLDLFTLLMLGAIACALLLPAEGRCLQLLHVVGTAGVSLLFLLHGAAIAPHQLRQGATQSRLHLLIFGLTFGVFPALTLTLTLLPREWAPEGLVTGFVYLGLLPSAVSSSIAFTALARGNVAAAVCSAAASNIVGLLLTPTLLALVLHVSAAAAFDVAGALREVGLQLLAPFAAGQALRPRLQLLLEPRKAQLERYDQGVIVLVVYVAVSASAAAGAWAQVSWPLLAACAGLCVLLLVVVFAISIASARLAGLPRADEIAAVFCGTKKSLATGLPLAQVLFGDAPTFGLIVLPIIFYNQIQILAGAAVARRYAAGMQGQAT